MAQLVVRNLDESVKDGLRRRAARRGRSMEEEVRDILRTAIAGENPRHRKLGSWAAKHFAGLGLKDEIPEIRRRLTKPARFDD